MATCGLMPLRVPTTWTSHDARPSVPICSVCPCSLHTRTDHFHPTSVRSSAQPTKIPGRARARARKKLAYLASHASRLLPWTFQKRKTTRGLSKNEKPRVDTHKTNSKNQAARARPPRSAKNTVRPAVPQLPQKIMSTLSPFHSHRSFAISSQKLHLIRSKHSCAIQKSVQLSRNPYQPWRP